MTITQQDNLRLTIDSLCELDGNQAIVTIPREQILSIALRHGIKVPHPILQILMGLVLMGIGTLPLAHLVRWMIRGGTFVTVEALVIPFVLLGAWQIVSAVIPGYFLHIQIQTGPKKIAIDRRCTRPSIETFLTTLESMWNMKVDRQA